MELPLEKKVHRNDLKEVHSNIEKADILLDELCPNEMVTFFDYAYFGHCFSSGLIDACLYDSYRKFVRTYNQTLSDYYQPCLDFINSVYTSLALSRGVFAGMGKPSFAIEDKTDIFNGLEFKQEAIFERLLYEELKLWSHDWNVSRQRKLGFGLCDLDIVQGDEKLAIELKRSVAKRKDIYQAAEYSQGNTGFVSSIIASGFDKDALELADQMNVVCYKYYPAIPEGCEVPELFILDRLNNPRKITKIEQEFEEIERSNGFFIEYTDIPTVRESSEMYHKKFDTFCKDLQGAAMLAQQAANG